MQITELQLKQIISPIVYNDIHIASITKALNSTFQKYSINTTLRICHFLAHVLHESGCFRYSIEIWGNTPAQQGYDTRTDLGNTPEHDGDGYKYRGRGWIELTGKANYEGASKEFGQDFVNYPELVGQEPWDGLVSGWYWDKHHLNAIADRNDILGTTKGVNGGYNGLDKRKMWLIKCKEVIK